MGKGRVLVTDGEQRAALAVVRSLGQAGYEVRVCSARGRSLAGASRHCRVERRVADALSEPARFVEEVAALLDEWGVDVLIPVTEASLFALLGARERLGRVRIPFADLGTLRAISDKGALLDIAPEVGIAIPQQRIVACPESWADADVASLPFPVVLKPSRSVADRDGRQVKLTVRHAANAAELDAARRDLPAAAYPLLVQQRIVGPGVGIFLLIWDGEVVATFAHRRLREKPPAGGVSVYRESIAADPTLVARSRALLERFGWRGVAMVEYKVDAATGTPYLMEVNGRFWGSLQLAVDAGVDFPVLLLRAAAGDHPAPVSEYRAGIRSRWEWGDVDHLLARLRRSAPDLSLPPDAPGRWRAVASVLRPWRPGDRGEILRLRDPWPFLRETVDWLRRR